MRGSIQNRNYFPMNKFLKRHKEVLILILLFCAAFIIRAYKLPESLFFGFEQGRDAEVIKGIYSFKDFVLTGPSTSIGGVFHGSWYYYLMAIPYGLSFGNPLAASCFLIFLGSIVPIVIYFLAKDLLRSKSWAFFAGALTVFSYEYILYSRWLSNVSPAPLFIALALLFLWKYASSDKSLFFLFFIISASLASLFQMILIFQFIFVFLLFIVFKIIKLPSFKLLMGSGLSILFLFAPLIIFDFRNQHISWLSLLKFAGGGDGGSHRDIYLNVLQYWKQTEKHFADSIINIDFIPFQILIMGIIFGVFIALLKKKENHKRALFIIIWILMGTILIYIGPGNPQYYVGVGLGWVLAFIMTVKFFWEKKNFRIIAFALIVLFIIGFGKTLIDLTKNENVFFRTIQDDLNLFDQKRVLNFIHHDSNGYPYRFISFTIPYLQPEGWDYLHKYYYPSDKYGTELIYIVIENHVASVWEEKWIGDLGRSKLVGQQYFGKFRVQKRILEN